MTGPLKSSGSLNRERSERPSTKPPAQPAAENSLVEPRTDPTRLGTIKAKDFSFWYGEKQALFDITLTIRPRAITALIGPSGCGKSTFARKHFKPTEVLSSDAFRGLVSDNENDQRKDNDDDSQFQRG